jgi:uracil-DNA glycosylase
MEDVAFTNALPCRTRSQSAFSTRVAKDAAKLYVRPVIDELSPKIIVAVGKRAGEIVVLAQRSSDRVVVWNRERALRPSVIEDRQRATRIFAELITAL